MSFVRKFSLPSSLRVKHRRDRSSSDPIQLRTGSLDTSSQNASDSSGARQSLSRDADSHSILNLETSKQSGAFRRLSFSHRRMKSKSRPEEVASTPRPQADAESCYSIDSVMSMSSQSGYGSDDCMVEKGTIGKKYSLGRATGDKKSVTVVLNDDQHVCEFTTRATETLDRVRLRLGKVAKGKAPIAFRFCYSDGIPVEFTNENTTRLRSCFMGDTTIHIYTAKGMIKKKPTAFAEFSDRVSKVSEDAESVVRCCLRLLEAFDGQTKAPLVSLPSPLPSCALFFRDLGRATLEAPSESKVSWQLIENELKEIERHLKTTLRRPKFVALMTYRADLHGISECVKKIQKELLRAKINDDHPVFFVKTDKPAPEIGSLLTALGRVSFMDLCGEKHAATRRRIANLLSMSEADVVDSIKNKGVSTVLERGMFRNANKPMVKVSSYTSLTDSDAIRDLLAPHIKSQDALIAKQAEKFNSQTYQWAMKDFDSWVNDLKSSRRCFLVAGAPGSGKTTFVSHVIQERSHVILASHFCRHDDVTTTNGKVMLLSIVYQLCLHSVSFESKIRALLIRKRMTRKQLLSADYPTASLYHDFIDGPLQSIEVSAKDNQCIVIDGLDLGNEGSSTKNPILKVIRSYLSFLPPWLRLVVATRPHVPIFKALRSFNAQMSEPQEHETFEDLSNLFNESLSDIDFGREGSRRLFADTLATTAHGNYAYATILTEKAKLATLSSDRSIVGEYLNLDFDQVLEKDLAVATDVDPDAFWALVRMLMVAFRAFTALDIQALTGFSKERLDRLLGSSTTFFVRDGSTVRFVENIVKCWLLTRIHIQNSAAGLTEELSIKKRKQLNKITCSATLKATLQEDMMHCHEILAERILTTLLEKDGSEFSFASDSTKGYVLQYGIRHIILAQRESDARDVVLDPYWIMERATDTGGVLEDLNIFYENDEVLQLLKRAISLSASAIEKDPRQIIGQLVGRLKAATIEDHGNRAVKQEVQAFVGRLESGDYGFEWWCPVAPTWDKAEQTLVRQMKGHDGQIQSVQLHPNDTLCATACEDGQVRVFNVFTGICTAKFSGHSGVVWEVNWSSAGDRLVSASSDTTVRVTRYPCGEPELVLKGHTDAVFSVKFSPDSSLIASGSKDGTIRIWCAGTGECLRMLKCDNCFVYSVDWKPGVENQYLCSGGTDNTVRIWNIQSSALPRVCYGHKDWVRSVAWSSNGNDIFSGSNDLTVICWDAASGECEQVLMGHKGGIWDVGQSQDGRYVFSGSVDGSCKVWECSTWRCDQTLKGHTGAVLSLSVSTDGARLLTGGSDSALIEWDCEVERTVSDLDDHSKPVWSVDISPDEKYVLSASSDSTARLWSLSTGVAERVFAGHTGPVWKARFSRSGDKIATASSDNTAAIYRLSTAGRILELQHSDAVWDVAWSKDDRALYTASRDHIIRCWCAKTGRCQHILKGHTKDVKSLSVSSDGTRLASASTDGSIRIWNLETHVCQRILYGQDAGALSVDWCPDNVHVVAGDTIGCVRQYNADSGERVVGFLSGHTRRANAVSCSGDGLRVASASTDKEIRIWNIEKQTCERRIAAGIGLGVFCVKYISGNRVISGGADRSIRVWNTENGRCEAVMAGVTGLGIYDVVFSPDGAFVASGSRDRTVQIWDAETGKCVKTFKGHTNWVHSVEWEVGGKRVLSQSDDGTSRIWNVETGDCDEVIENIGIPPNFIVGSASSISTDLSRKSDDGNPVGIQCDKVKICGERACGWIGKTVVFFKLQKSDDFEQSMHEIEPEDLSIFMAKKEIVFRRGSLSLKRMPTSSNSMGSHPLNFATTCA